MTSGAADRELIDRFRAARGDPARAILEGFHALKHALRFGARVEAVVTSDPEGVDELARGLAPDVGDALRALATPIADEAYRRLGGYAHHTRVVAIAERPRFDAAEALARRDAPAVYLEDPRHLGNLGAVVRVAAAVDAAAVLTTGRQDPWDPTAIRGSGGLHFALPVGRVDELDTHGRPLLALDPDGDDLTPGGIPVDAVLAFGTERHGVSDDLLSRADGRLRIPMRAGVSSLNLATSVAAVLFAWRLSAG
jgi:TrmH family RNA methyltransferase